VGPLALLGEPMTGDVLDHDRVEAWRREHPREWWALQKVCRDDALRQRVMAAVLSGREEDEAIDEIVRLAEASESNIKAAKAGTLEPPPETGDRRAMEVLVKRMKKLVGEDGRPFFRVDFSTRYGWDGYFDTTAPDVVEKISKHRRRSRPLTIVGTVVVRPHDFLVVLDDRVRVT
jgi:hypothetical protein